MPIDAPTIVLAAAAVLTLVLLVGWLRTRASRRPDRSMAQFQDALVALRPDEDDAASDGSDDRHDEVTTSGRDG